MTTKHPVTHDMRTEAGKTWLRLTLLPAILLHAAGRTLRGLQYALVGRAIFKTVGDFAQVNRVVRGMRLDGSLGWYELDERHRTLHARGGWEDVGQFLRNLASTYDRDIQQGQPDYVVVLYEADGMTGIVSDVCGEFGAAYAAMKGNISDVLLWKVARAARQQKKPLVALVITDHDSSGQAIFTDVKNSLPWFYWTPPSSSVKDYIEGVTGERFDPYSPMPEVTLLDVTVIHLGVTPTLLASLAARGIDVPSDPEANKGSKTFVDGGFEPTQAEAIDPDIWRELLREAIEDHTDMDELERQKSIQRTEVKRLVDISDREGS